jgi:hypothetical protein
MLSVAYYRLHSVLISAICPTPGAVDGIKISPLSSKFGGGSLLHKYKKPKKRKVMGKNVSRKKLLIIN